jgi:hypothetical protein
MLTKIALAAAGLALAAAPGIFHVVKAAPESRAVPQASFVPAASQSKSDQRFAPVCRGDEILDSRPDPRWVGESFNNDRCRAPRLPAVLNGATATREQVVAAMEEVKRYAAAADAFQRCVSDFVAARKASIASGQKPLSPSEAIIENHRILVSQRSKETAAAQVRVAINTFNRYGSDCE